MIWIIIIFLIATIPPTNCCIIISPIIIHQPQFTIPYLATPLNRLGERAGGCHLAEGGVGVGGGDTAFRRVELADILGEIRTVCVPCAVDSDGQRAGGNGLGGIPGHEPHHRVMAAGEVDAGNLQIPPVDVSLVQRYGAVDTNFLKATAPHEIVGAFNDRAGVIVHEAHGAVFGVVDSCPNTGIGHDEGLVPVSVELRGECFLRIFLNGGVLIERVGGVNGRVITFHSGGAVANVIVGVLVLRAIDLCRLISC